MGAAKISSFEFQYLHPPPCHIKWTFPKAAKPNCVTVRIFEFIEKILSVGISKSFTSPNYPVRGIYLNIHKTRSFILCIIARLAEKGRVFK